MSEHKWTMLAADLLDRAAAAFAAHGCNDWSFPEDWTEAERLDFAYAMMAWNVHGCELTNDEREDVEHWAHGGMPDWLVMHLLSHCIRTGT